jgi:transposase-like protein
MTQISYKRCRFPATVSQHAVWLCFGFTLSLRDIEELPAQRGVGVSYETVRCWASRVGPAAETCRRVGRWLIVDEVRTVTQHQSKLADDAGWGGHQPAALQKPAQATFA